MSAPFTVRFAETGHERNLLSGVSEKTAKAFARSESGVYRTAVTLWQGDRLVAAFDSGKEDATVGQA